MSTSLWGEFCVKFYFFGNNLCRLFNVLNLQLLYWAGVLKAGFLLSEFGRANRYDRML